MLVNRRSLAAASLVLATFSCASSSGTGSSGSSGSLTGASGSLQLFVDRNVLRPGFTDLKLVTARVDLYYSNKQPPPVLGNHTMCDGPNKTTVSASPLTLDVPLQLTGPVFLGAFDAPIGAVTEIRIVMPTLAGTYLGQAADVRTMLDCGVGSDRQVVRLVPHDGLPFEIALGSTTRVAAELDALKQLRLKKQHCAGGHASGDHGDGDRGGGASHGGDHGSGDQNNDDHGGDASHDDDGDHDEGDHDEGDHVHQTCPGAKFVLDSTLLAGVMSDQVNGRGIVNVFREAVSGSYVVRFADGMTPATITATADEFRTRFGGTRGPVYTGAVPSAAYAGWTPAIAHAVALDSRVLFVDQDAIFHLADTQQLTGANSDPAEPDPSGSYRCGSGGERKRGYDHNCACACARSADRRCDGDADASALGRGGAEQRLELRVSRRSLRSGYSGTGGDDDRDDLAIAGSHLSGGGLCQRRCRSVD